MGSEQDEKAVSGATHAVLALYHQKKEIIRLGKEEERSNIGLLAHPHAVNLQYGWRATFYGK